MWEAEQGEAPSPAREGQTALAASHEVTATVTIQTRVDNTWQESYSSPILTQSTTALQNH